MPFFAAFFEYLATEFLIAVGATTASVATLQAVAWTFQAIAVIGLSMATSRLLAPKMPSLSDLSGREEMTRNPISPRQIIYGQCKVSGPVVFLATSGAKNQFLHIVVALAGHQVEEIGDVYFNDDLVLSGSGDGYGSGIFSACLIHKKLGTASQTVDTTLNSDFPTDWDSSHRLRGIAYIYAKLTYDANVFPGGIPNISAIVKGKLCYNPTGGATAYTANPALCLRDYLTDTDLGLGMTSAEVDDVAVAAAATICDEAVNHLPSGTEARYTCNGMVLTSSTPDSIIGQILSSMGGTIAYSGGKVVPLAGAYRSPAITLDETHLAGGISVQTRMSARDRINGVKGTYVSSANQWQPADFPSVTSATYVTEDNGVEYWRDIVLSFTTSSNAAQRLAIIQLRQAREEIVFTAQFNLHAMRLRAGDTVQITNTKLGWSSKVFEVIEWSFATSGTPPQPVIAMTMRETASTIYSWDVADEVAVTGAANTDLPDPFTVPTPSLTLLTDATTVLIQPDGTVMPRLKVSWITPNEIAVENDGYVEIEYKKTTDSDYTVWAAVRGDALFDYILDVNVGIAYDVRARFRNSLGVRGAYATSTSSAIVTVTVTPSNPTAATKTAEGTYKSTDGTIMAFLTLSLPALPANAAKQFLFYRKSTDTQWVVAAGPFTNTGTLTGINLMDLSPGIIYAVATMAMSSLDTPSAFVDATSSPFTAPSATTAPAVPTGLASVLGTGKAVSLDWDDNTEADFIAYAVYRGTTNPPTVKIAEISASRFVDIDVTLGTLYYYAVSAINTTRVESAKCTAVSATPSTVPATSTDGTAPTDPSAPGLTSNPALLTAYTAADGTVLSRATIDMPAVPALAKYMNLLYKRSVDTLWMIAGSTSTGSIGLPVNDLTPGESYDFGIQAMSAFGVASNIVLMTGSPYTAAGKLSGPGVVTGLTFTAGNSGSYGRFPAFLGGVLAWSWRANWTAPTDADLAYFEVALTSINTDAAANAASKTRVDRAACEYISSALIWATTYFRVRAVNASGVAGSWVDGGGDVQGNYAKPLTLGDSSSKDVGTAANTVAAGDDSRITGAAQKSSNLSDLGNASTARSNLGVTATGADTSYCYRSNNLSDVTAATARGNLGVTATGADTTYCYRSNNLSDVTAATARTNLGLSTGATKRIFAGNVNVTLSGGGASELFTISLSGSGFSAAPVCGLLGCVDPLYVIVYESTNGSNSSSTAYCRIRSTDGSTVPGTTTPVSFLFTD